MKKALIKISYTQIIDAASAGAFEKNIFNATYNEFLLKCQAYNVEDKYQTFQQMVAADGRANSLHYKISFPVGPYVDLLNKIIPGAIDNSGGDLNFETYQLKLIESHITDKSKHKFAIIYFTPTLVLLDNASDYLVLTKQREKEDTTEKPDSSPMKNTFLIKIIPNFSICEYIEYPG